MSVVYDEKAGSNLIVIYLFVVSHFVAGGNRIIPWYFSKCLLGTHIGGFEV